MQADVIPNIVPQIVSPTEWLEARKQFLLKEKEFTRLRDELSRQRRELPWRRVEKSYVFAGPGGEVKLGDLFAGRSQLVIYHFMFGPDWQEGCPICSFEADHFNAFTHHLNARDVSLVAVSRAPLPRIETFKQRLGWTFPWVSSSESDFNFDYHVSFTKEEIALGQGNVYYNYGLQPFPADEAPGVSVFYKDASGEIFHTYSTYARGLDILLGAYNYLDLVPKGRDEEGLPFTMAWVRHHDKYEQGLPSPVGAKPASVKAADCGCSTSARA